MLIGSVGQHGTNLQPDTRAVQSLLNDLRMAQGSPPLKVDGIVGPKTISAIVEFQKLYALPKCDGRIDPNGPTLSELDKQCANMYASIAYAQSSKLLLQFQTPGRALPPKASYWLQQIREQIAGLQPKTATTGLSRFTVGAVQPSFVPASFRLPVLGAVQVVPVIIVLFFFLLLMLIVVSNPVWQRAAREMVKGIQDRLRLMSQKIRDAIEDMVKTIEDAVKSSPCAEVCATEVARLRDLQKQINDLLDRMPANDNDPESLKAMKFLLARLLDEIQKAQQEVIDCLARNGC